MNNTKHSVSVKNKKYNYTLVPKTKDTTFIECTAAKIAQEFLNEDIPAVLANLPNLIVAEQEYKNAQSVVVHFRIKSDEKQKLENAAMKNGFKTISSYMRNLALTAQVSK